MDTREMVYTKLEQDLGGDSGTLIFPKTLMGNISKEEIEHYLRIRGYDVPNRDEDSREIHFHYRLKGVSANA